MDIDGESTDTTCIFIDDLNGEYVKKHGKNYKGVVILEYENGEFKPTVHLTN